MSKQPTRRRRLLYASRWRAPSLSIREHVRRIEDVLKRATGR